MTPTIEDAAEKEFNEWEKLIPKELSELLSDFAMNHTYPVRGVLRNLFKAASLQTPSNEKYGWVKANERRPESKGFYYAEDSIGNKTMVHFYDEHWHSLTGHPIVKWLDESTPIPILTPCGWVKSDDVLAPDCVIVLACIDDEDEPIMAYLSHEVGKWYGVHTSSKYIETPSHWMPLPKK